MELLNHDFSDNQKYHCPFPNQIYFYINLTLKNIKTVKYEIIKEVEVCRKAL